MELYQIIMDNDTFYYTSGESDFTLANQTYKAVSIYRQELSKDSLNDDAKIVCNFDLEPINLYKEFNPSVGVYVRILNTKGNQLFLGRIKGVEFNINKGEATISLSAVGGLLKAKIPVRTYSKECGFNLFDSGCGLKSENYRVTLSNNFSISDDKLEISSSALSTKQDGFFNGGYAKFGNQYSYISSHKGDKITLMFPLKSLSTADLVYVYAGCDKTIKMCRDKFNNSINYGGFPFVPSKNPVTQGF